MGREHRVRVVALIIIGLTLLSMIVFTIIPGSLLHRLTTPVNGVLEPAQKGIKSFVTQVRTWFTTNSENRLLRKENESLKEQNVALRLQLKENEQAALAYADLKAAFNLKDRFVSHRFQATNILYKPVLGESGFFRLDIGLKDGLSADNLPGYGVIDDQGRLVGMIYSADDTTSRMVSLSDPSFAANVYATSDRLNLFRLQGGFNDENHQIELLADQLSQDTALGEGDSIYTSGRGGLFPEGILCGQVKRVLNNSQNGYTKAIVQTEARPDLENVLFVLIPQEMADVKPEG